ncbi:uncharacterized protein IUM83_03027 [Phytophthora cinnamomi]|uniref:uncharacterized protein n=1 Tax=Phytophthora cinnamomi TaxID=4785 RepID=UPI00355A1221|nr:hypothetical protein IUM83_03027 [Phytophthora cinnamomi]
MIPAQRFATTAAGSTRLEAREASVRASSVRELVSVMAALACTGLEIRSVLLCHAALGVGVQTSAEGEEGSRQASLSQHAIDSCSQQSSRASGSERPASVGKDVHVVAGGVQPQIIARGRSLAGRVSDNLNCCMHNATRSSTSSSACSH